MNFGPSQRRYMLAVVLGTALSAMAPSEVEAASAQTVHEISRYCSTCWRNARLHPDAWSDCTQEVFCRLLERVTPEAWSRVFDLDAAERLEFLRAIDCVKKRSQRGRKWDRHDPDQTGDPQVRDQEARREARLMIEEAARQLSSRQRDIIRWTLDGWSVHEIASEMKVPAERVSDEKYKAIHKLRKLMVA